MLEMVRVSGPLLVTVRVCGVLEVLTFWPAKVSEEGATVTVGPEPPVLVKPVVMEKKEAGLFWLLKEEVTQSWEKTMPLEETRTSSKASLEILVGPPLPLRAAMELLRRETLRESAMVVRDWLMPST